MITEDDKKAAKEWACTLITSCDVDPHDAFEDNEKSFLAGIAHAHRLREPKRDSLIPKDGSIYNNCKRVMFVLGGVQACNDSAVDDFVGLLEKVIRLAREK